ncbi:MAG: monothiol glutaredoxin [Planctomycetota bacterium]|jgi:monothiol glutaredoxin
MWNKEKVAEIVGDNKLVVFAKGTRDQPQCGFSARAFTILEMLGHPFEVINIFEDPDIRPSLVAFSEWPTTPQVFLNGEFIGGSDVVLEMFEKGDLKKQADAVFAQ